MDKKYCLCWVIPALFIGIFLNSGLGFCDEKYQTPQEIVKLLKGLEKKNKGLVRLHIIAESPGGDDVVLMEIGDSNSTKPAIMVIANMEGNSPLASEAAVKLAKYLVTDWKEEILKHRWYILPVGNPDGYARFYKIPLNARFVNGLPVNEDHDDTTDEDGPEDLNKDGWITAMRQKHPEGKWVVVKENPLLMRKADVGKGEIGIYRLFSEGIDNDKDGKINEDGPGGINPGHNFPHRFSYYQSTRGPWSAFAEETRAVLKFTFDHPEIAIVITLGQSNSLKEVPKSKNKAQAVDKVKVPGRWARWLGLEADQEYPVKEVVLVAREAMGDPSIDEDRVLQMLGGGAAVNPDRKDLPVWKEISKRYNEFLKEIKMDVKRLTPADFSLGCVEEWAYYQYGVPTFSMDFWTLPEPKKDEKKGEDSLSAEKVEKMSNKEFIDLGKEKIEAFLKANEIPAQFSADRVIKGLEGGMMTTKRMADMMQRMKKKKDESKTEEADEALFAYRPKAFLKWESYDHPTLGEVEIGGKIPYSDLAPSADSADVWIEKQIPFIKTMVTYLPDIRIDRVDTKLLTANTFRITAWIVNQGLLSYPTYQGQRSRRPVPVVATLDGKALTLYEGKARKVLGLLTGSGGSQKVSWVVKGKKNDRMTLTVQGPSIGEIKNEIILRGGDK